MKPRDPWWGPWLDGELGRWLPPSLLQWLWAKRPDRCQYPHCQGGGMRGNENVINAVTLCDYCCADSAATAWAGLQSRVIYWGK